MPGVLRVNEIFHSIQGESTAAGLPCVFVRLTGCHLRCSWCDTTYAFHEGRPMSVDEVLDEVARYPCRTVELTGGEPLLQPEAIPLMARLLAHGYRVLLETGGAAPIDAVPEGVTVVLDVKCPGSGESARNLWENLDRSGRATRSSSWFATARTMFGRSERSRSVDCTRARSC